MIRFTKGNLLDSHAAAVVNTVNTVGVMGKGIALMFKEAFPANYREYAAACERDEERARAGVRTLILLMTRIIPCRHSGGDRTRTHIMMGFRPERLPDYDSRNLH
jgi:hypothetical protein